MRFVFFVIPMIFMSAASVMAESATVTVHRVSSEGVGEELGTIRLSDAQAGVLISPHLRGLSAGEHGFHIHENPSCAPAEKEGKLTAAQAAGGHFDPEKTGRHEGPSGHGHQGDLMVLKVQADGTASEPMTVPHRTVAQFKNRSIMIHEGGDNYSDSPKPLGGGGSRIACGVIE